MRTGRRGDREARVREVVGWQFGAASQWWTTLIATSATRTRAATSASRARTATRLAVCRAFRRVGQGRRRGGELAVRGHGRDQPDPAGGDSSHKG